MSDSGRLSCAKCRIICILALICRALLPPADHVLSAQAGVSIFVPEVTGTGSSPDDSDFFTQMLMMEVAARNYQLGDSRGDSLYSMNGSLSPIVPEYDAEDSLPPEYSLHLTLVETETEAILIEQDLVYTLPEDANAVLPVLVFTMLASIPPQPQPEPVPIPVPVGLSEDWRQKWWYFSAFGCWTPRIYMGNLESTSMINFGFGLATEIQFLNFMSFEAGVEIAQDWVVIAPDDKTEYRSHVLEIPAFLKLIFKPASYFMIEPYGGIQVNIPLNELTSPPLLSWAAGLQYGVKAGPGAVFVDARFIMDIGDSVAMMEPDPYQYQRRVLKLAVGYKIGVFPRKKKEPPTDQTEKSI
jgi:hypothetical protein